MSSYGTPGDDGYGGMSDSFSDKAVRLGFIRKVYAILCTQLAVTAGIVAIFRIKSISDTHKKISGCFGWLLPAPFPV